ncbi:MAG TPA: hypothetical protein VLT90_09945 [Terriglobales bacterium]|nr:hypothetical protein [Terriglobales bacterium]
MTPSRALGLWRIRTVAFLVLLSSIASAQTLSGVVTNGTNGKPAAGDEVILINLSKGMEEAAKTRADAAGKFSFKLTDGGGPHLIRAVHQGVTYHKMAPAGTNSVQLDVYDVARKIADLSVTADVMRFQTDGDALHGTRLFAVNNGSTPPKTQMNDHNFEFYLPEGAKIESTQAKAPNGQPIAADTAPQAEKNRYAIAFPLRPGETQFQIEFTMPYSGRLNLDPKPLYPAQHVVVVLPKTMQFTPANPQLFQSMQDPNSSDTNVQVAQQTQAGQSLAFTISGTGTISDSPSRVASGSAQSQGRDTRPGGGLGAPIDAPDPLQSFRWPILVGFGLILAIGAWVVMKRKPAISVVTTGTPSPADTHTPPGSATPGTAGPAASSTTPAVPKSAMLLEALKEEMFQLEVERKQGKISSAEYEKAKAALDQTLDRALKRQG